MGGESVQFRALNAAFGKLESCTLTFSDGLNIVEAPNESGKSTLAAFLRTMLYGLKTSERGALADKNRFSPWSGKPMRGSLEVLTEDGSITLRRDTARANSPMGRFSAVYTGTAEAAPFLSGSDCGETLLGVPREVYERSAFIRQSGLAIDQNAELERRIAALITTGEEGASYSEASAALRRQLNARKHNKTGKIPSLEREIDALEAELSDLRQLSSTRSAAENELPALKRGIPPLREELARLDRMDAQTRAQRETLHALQERADAAAARRAECERLLADFDRKHAAIANDGSVVPYLCASLAMSALALCSIFFSAPLYLPVGSAVIGAAALVLSLRARSKRILRQRETAAAREKLTDALQEAAASADALRAAYDDAAASAPEARSAHDRTALLRELESMESRCAELQRSIDFTDGRIRAIGERSELEASLAEKRAELDILYREYDAVTLAMDALEHANTTLQNRFSPALGERAAALFSELTGGKYSRLLLDRSFRAQAEESGDSVPHDALLLSQGACDQLYLAVRLAICELALPRDKNIPLVLDDALINFDDTRCQRALDLLLRESRTRQIILLTCHKRESAYLVGREGVTVLTLS